MTGAQMITAFDIYYDKIANLSAPGYEDSEKLLFLNNAQDDFIKERVFGKNFQPPAFDQNEKRVADIRLLLFTNTIATIVSPHYGGSSSIPVYLTNTDLRFLLKVEVEVTRTNPTITSVYVSATKISLEDVDKFQSNAFNRTWFKNPVYFSASYGYVYLIGDYYTTTMDNAKITYVRTPQAITDVIGDYRGVYSSDYLSIESQFHQEIIDKAVRHALATSGDQRYQIKVAEQQMKTE